ncbi:MAG: helix-turn-helix transcriptional regulator [Pasteurellaceae bacterium]|nr:helix-turn-helix transcriptional regulator [Pasteurellaceae bacterium]
MEIYDKVRVMREIRQWSQEEMADKMGMSVTGYAKIERGQSKLHYDKLEQIAQIFNICINDLVDIDKKEPTWYFKENHSNNISANYYSADNTIILELEKLKLTIENQQHILATKDELLAQKDNEIVALKEIIELLKKK